MSEFFVKKLQKMTITVLFAVFLVLLLTQSACAKPSVVEVDKDTWYKEGNVNLTIYKNVNSEKTKYIERSIRIRRDSIPSWSDSIVKPFEWDFDLSGNVGEMTLNDTKQSTFKEFTITDEKYQNANKYTYSYEGYNAFNPIILFKIPAGYRYENGSIGRESLYDAALIFQLPKTAYSFHKEDITVEAYLIIHAAQAGIKTDNKMHYTGNSMWMNIVPNETVVEYDAGNGNGEMDNQTVVYDTKTKLHKNMFTRAGYTFSEWRDATGKTYSDGMEVGDAFPDMQTIKLTAQWRANNFSVNFAHNEGSEGELPKANTITYASGTVAPHADKTLVNKGKIFIGWSTDKDAADKDNAMLYEPGDDISRLTEMPDDTVTLYPIFIDKDATKIYNVPKVVYKEYPESMELNFKVKFASSGRIVKLERLVINDWEQVDIMKLTGKEKNLKFTFPAKVPSRVYRIVVRETDGSKAAAAIFRLINNNMVADYKVLTGKHIKKAGNKYILSRENNAEGYQLKLKVTPANKQTLTLRAEGYYLTHKRISKDEKSKIVTFNLDENDVKTKYTNFVITSEMEAGEYWQMFEAAEFKMKKELRPEYLIIGDSRVIGMSGIRGNTVNGYVDSKATRALAKGANTDDTKISYFGVNAASSESWFKDGFFRDTVKAAGNLKTKKLQRKIEAMDDRKDGKSGVIFWLGINEIKNAKNYIANIKKLHKYYSDVKIHVMSVGGVYKKPYGITKKKINKFNKQLRKAFGGKKIKNVYYHNIKVKIGKKSGRWEKGGILHYNMETYAQFAKKMGMVVK